MTYLLDVNVLIALAWPNHVHHAGATRWFAEVHEAGWATTPTTESGFVRISSNARVFPEGVTPGQAAEVLGRYCALPGHDSVHSDIAVAQVAEVTEVESTVDEPEVAPPTEDAPSDDEAAMEPAAEEAAVAVVDDVVAEAAEIADEEAADA